MQRKMKIMVTREQNYVSFYRLHLKDMSNDRDVYRNVTSKNIHTLRSYAKKVEMLECLLLMDFYEVWMASDLIWLTKHYVRCKEVNLRERRYYLSAFSILKKFDEILGINPAV